MSLPTDYDARKASPLLTVLVAYFPDAIEALVQLCVQGNLQHKVDDTAVNPFKLSEDVITWDRSKSTDQLNTLTRHLWDHARAKRGVGSMRDVDKVLHIVKAFWRAGAEAQLTIERLREESRPDLIDDTHQVLDGGPGRPKVSGAKVRSLDAPSDPEYKRPAEDDVKKFISAVSRATGIHEDALRGAYRDGIPPKIHRRTRVTQSRPETSTPARKRRR